VRDLDVISTVFVKEIKERALLSKEEVFALFANTEKLMEIHLDFLDVCILVLYCCIVSC
jgi:hypothetical protein